MSFSDFLLNFQNDVRSILEAWRLGTSYLKKIAVQRSELSLDVLVLEYFLIVLFPMHNPSHHRVRWWLSMSS